MRGQGIKIFSLIINECSKNGYKVPVLDKIYKDDIDEDEDTKSSNQDNQNSINTNNNSDEYNDFKSKIR